LRMLNLFCGNLIFHLPVETFRRLSPAAELLNHQLLNSLIKRFRCSDSDSDPSMILIGIASERLSATVRNHYWTGA
jgi:hypothetical protein